MSRRGWLLFLAMSVIWGTPYLLIRVAVRELSPATLVFARTLPAAVLLVPLAWRRGQLRPLASRWRWVIAYTAAEIALPWLFLSRAEEHLTSSVAGLLVATVPLIAVVLYRWLSPDTERLTRRRLLGLFVGFAGVVALVGIDLHGTDLVAVAEMAVPAVGYSLGPLIISRRLSDLPPLGVVSASVALTAVVYAPAALTHRPTHTSLEVLAAVAGLAFLCTALAFLLFFALIAEIGPARSTVITYVNPAVAVLLGVVLLGEHFTAGIAVGFPLILVGSFLATSSPREAPNLSRSSGTSPDVRPRSR
ncbi:MAG TPA: DMT family transporter [Acidimicrobiales bacterium]|nr:DMT family transporter [Acidimicrobiales bacterium]